MGGLLAAASISAFIGLFAMVLSMEAGGTGGFFLLIALAINVAAIIRLFIEKKNKENVKFKTSQIVYIISGIICAIAGSYVVFMGWKSAAFISILFYIAFVVMIFDSMIVSFNYLVCYLQIRNGTGKGEFFMPSTENRNIKKHLRVAFGWLGAILIVVAACLLVIGIRDSGDSLPRYSFSDCYRCDNVGRYVQNGKLVTCTACNGAGYIANKLSNDGGNIVNGVTLWLGALGIGSLAMIKVLKDNE